MKNIVFLCIVLSMVCPAVDANTNARSCHILSEIWQKTNELEESAGVSFANTVLREGQNSAEFRALIEVAGTQFGLSAQSAHDFVLSLGLFSRSRIDEKTCNPETFSTAVEYLLRSYTGNPESSALADVVAQLLISDEEKSISPRVQELLQSMKNPCQAGIMLQERMGRSAMPLLEAVASVCSSDSEFLVALEGATESLLLKASILEQAWRECSGDCNQLFSETVKTMSEVGLAKRVVELLDENSSYEGSTAHQDLVVSLALSGDLAKASELASQAPIENSIGVNKVVNELIRTGTLSSRTAIEAYLNDRRRLYKLLFLSRFPSPGLRGTQASAARCILEDLEGMIERADAEIAKYPALYRFSEAKILSEIQLRETELLYLDVVGDVPGNLPGNLMFERFSGTTMQSMRGPCEGTQPLDGNLYTVSEALVNSPRKCEYRVAKGPVGPVTQGLWVICHDGASSRRGLLAIRGRSPLPRYDPFSLDSLSTACIEGGDSAVRVSLGELSLEINLEDALGDPDGDGLPSSFEKYLGTNPNSADSDRDGVTDANDPVPSFVERSITDQLWLKAAEVFWMEKISPFFARSQDDRLKEKFGGTLFVITADREMAFAAAGIGVQVVPLLHHEVTGLIPREATIKIKMFGVDEKEGIAFFSWKWGNSAGFVFLELIDGAWTITFDSSDSSDSSIIS